MHKVYEVDFEEVIAETLDGLPAEIAMRMDNVEVVVEDEPGPEVVATLPPGQVLFGLYHGIPLTKRGNYYNVVLPDRISIYRRAITRYWRTPDAIRAQIRRTVLHEIGHYFGISEDRLHELGWG